MMTNALYFIIPAIIVKKK